MTEPKDLLLINEQLRRSNRRWKALALAACTVLIAVIGVIAVVTWLLTLPVVISP